MIPILHKEDTCPVDIENLNWGYEWVLSLLIALWPDDALQPNWRSDDDFAVVETAEVGQLLPLLCKFETYSEKIVLVLYRLQLLFVLYLVIWKFLLDELDNGLGVPHKGSKDEDFAVGEAFAFLGLLASVEVSKWVHNYDFSKGLYFLLLAVLDVNMVEVAIYQSFGRIQWLIRALFNIFCQ